MFSETMSGVINADYGMGYGMGWGMGWGHGLVGWIILALVIAVIIAFATRMWRGERDAGAGDSALDILGRRFANGEISDDEYREKRTVLKSRR